MEDTQMQDTQAATSASTVDMLKQTFLARSQEAYQAFIAVLNTLPLLNKHAAQAMARFDEANYWTSRAIMEAEFEVTPVTSECAPVPAPINSELGEAKEAAPTDEIPQDTVV